MPDPKGAPDSGEVMHFSGVGDPERFDPLVEVPLSVLSEAYMEQGRREILREIAAISPFVPSDAYCAFCLDRDTHQPDCLWVRAQAATEKVTPQGDSFQQLSIEMRLQDAPHERPDYLAPGDVFTVEGEYVVNPATAELDGPLPRLVVGDIIQVRGPSAPPDLRDKWFRVDTIDPDGTVRLSVPYLDHDCQHLYRP